MNRSWIVLCCSFDDANFCHHSMHFEMTKTSPKNFQSLAGCCCLLMMINLMNLFHAFEL